MTSAPFVLLSALAALAILVGLGVWLARGRQRRHRRIGFQRQLEQAVADGVLTPEELHHLEHLRAQGELSDAEVRMAALAVYRRALAAAMADARVTADEHESLSRMQELLGLTERDLAGDSAHLRRMRLLRQLEEGELPHVESPIDLPGENAHWVVQATLCERIAYGAAPPSEPRHLLYAADGTEPFSAAGERDSLGTSSSVLPVDLGIVVVTSRALRFRGARSQLVIALPRVRRIALFRDGLRLDLGDPVASRYFLLSDPELTAALLLLAARRARGAGPATAPEPAA